ncbi:MAG: Bcr/CflA family drug resistance efflux transporter, partial [Chthoniobacterales bacterium]
MSAPPTSHSPLTVRRSLPWLIAALSMVGPFAIDTYLPSFREMEASLGASSIEIQQSLTAFLLP